MAFPADFLWGASTAAYQIEGAAFADGKGPSIWDTFCRKPGAVWRGQSGEVACDHYHRFEEDVALMRQFGLTAYRCSISWPRVLPAGAGAVNARGLDFYDRLVDALLAAGIAPAITLFHWDYPYELYCRGGWLSPDSPDWFADYATVVAGRLGDRVQHWMTLNEPSVFVNHGHFDGVHAPGLRLSHTDDFFRITHHVLLAHGKGVQAIRAAAPAPVQVGYAPVGAVAIPASADPADIAAAREQMFAYRDDQYWGNAWWIEPALRGVYPEAGLRRHAALMPGDVQADLKTICQPLDFFGFNNYQAETVRAGADGTPEVMAAPVGEPLTALRWSVTPDSLYWGAKFFWERYGLPLAVTENGMSGLDWPALDGRVHDPQRIDFLHRYLLAFERAGDEGAQLLGYFTWSFLDNFEWAQGYQERFGLVHVDYPTGRRTPKDSAHWYAEVIRTHGASLHQPEPVG